MHPHALRERFELSQTLRSTGPDAPTLCGDWTTKVLAAHLVQRERSLAEVLGRLPIAQLRTRADRALHALAADEPYERLVQAVADGPPWLSPWALPPLREAVNLLEYLIHHEDVRRAARVPQPPRALALERQRAVWNRLRVAAALTMRTVPVPVTLVWSGHGQIRAGRGSGPGVRVTGTPVELGLVAFGRQRVARVDYDGAAADTATVSGARIAI